MDKSPDAFRTISEVAEVLDTPAHVLRFWESRFPQIRPVKRAGGRRYYRPADVALLTGIKHLLHDEGMTIRGVQKILREQGVRHVAALSGQEVPDEAEDAEAALEAALSANFGISADPAPEHAEVESAQIVALESALRARDADPSPPPAAPAEVLPLFDYAAEAPRPPPAPKAVEAAPEAAFWQEPEAISGTRTAVAADAGLLQRLQALPAASLAASPEALALHDRLRALVARLTAPAPQAPL